MTMKAHKNYNEDFLWNEKKKNTVSEIYGALE